jgi:hypothetical protein
MVTQSRKAAMVKLATSALVWISSLPENAGWDRSAEIVKAEAVLASALSLEVSTSITTP